MKPYFYALARDMGFEESVTDTSGWALLVHLSPHLDWGHCEARGTRVCWVQVPAQGRHFRQGSLGCKNK